MTKTEQTLLNRSRFGDGSVYVNGKREVDAAKKLIEKGLAKSFKDLSGRSDGERYFHPFTRQVCFSRSKFVFSGSLYF